MIRRLAADLPQLWADPHQIQQVIVNVLTNAHQALRTVSTRRRLVLTTRYERATDRIVLEVADSGPGVAADIGGRIFDPFFTTKAPGEGTGLGLSLCRGIIDAHDGTLRLEPTQGGGATFVVELPAGAAAAAGDGHRAETRLDPEPGKTILVVDDEPDVAELLAEALLLDGHRVDTANSGAAALDRLAERSYDLVFSDMKMPGMSGVELYDEVARRRPGLERRIIFVTGDTLNPLTKRFLDRTGAPSLSKPFGLDAVRRSRSAARHGAARERRGRRAPRLSRRRFRSNRAVGASPIRTAARRRAPRAARSPRRTAAPMSCRLIGRPARVKPHGTAMAGSAGERGRGHVGAPREERPRDLVPAGDRRRARAIGGAAWGASGTAADRSGRAPPAARARISARAARPWWYARRESGWP